MSEESVIDFGYPSFIPIDGGSECSFRGLIVASLDEEVHELSHAICTPEILCNVFVSDYSQMIMTRLRILILFDALQLAVYGESIRTEVTADLKMFRVDHSFQVYTTQAKFLHAVCALLGELLRIIFAQVHSKMKSLSLELFEYDTPPFFISACCLI